MVSALFLALVLATPAWSVQDPADVPPAESGEESTGEAPQEIPGEAPGELEEELLEAEPPTSLDPQEIEELTEEASRAEATEIAGEDAALVERLRSIFAALEDLRRVRVDVQAGIVVLSGRAATRDDADRAADMARALDGVVVVVNEIEVEKSMLRRLRASWESAKIRLRTAVGYLPLLGVAAVIVLLAWLFARLLRDARFLYRFAGERVLLQNLLRQTVFVAVLVGGVMVALHFLDAGALIGTALGAAGVVGLALGFAFRNIVENYLAGVLLAIRQPFRVRDDVSIDGSLGTVLRMTASETTLLDPDGNHLRLPNAMIFNGKVINYTRNPLRRFTIGVGVGTAVDLGRAQRIGVETLERMNGIVDDPAPSARVAALGDSTVLLELNGWVDQRHASYLKAFSEATRLVKVAFDEAGIAMPAPEYLVQLDAPRGTELPAAEGGERAAAEDTPTDSGPAPEAVDVSAEDDTARQVEEEIARSSEENLLKEPEEPPRA